MRMDFRIPELNVPPEAVGDDTGQNTNEQQGRCVRVKRKQNGRDHSDFEKQPLAETPVSAASLDDLVTKLRIEYRRRVLAMNSFNRQENAFRAYFRMVQGFNPESDDKDSMQAIKKRAQDIVSWCVKDRVAAEKAAKKFKIHKRREPKDSEVKKLIEAYPDECELAAVCLVPLKMWKDEQERELAAVLDRLPGTEWALGIGGINYMSIATIIGEAGNLSNYATKARIFNRLAVGVIDGHRQGNPGPKAKAADWIAEKYSPARHGRIHGSVTTPLFLRQSVLKAQGSPAPYRDIYDRSREIYDARVEATKDDPAKIDKKVNPDKWTPARSNNAARRYMTKAFIKHYWQAWRRDVESGKF